MTAVHRITDRLARLFYEKVPEVIRMKYHHIVPAVFRSRPNRFIANVEIDGKPETVHVKNTGRCQELLVPGAQVYLERADRTGRKTKYDLVAVRKAGGALFNIDSMAPSQAVREWLEGKGFDKIVPEYKYGNSRIDFYMEKNDQKYLMEVKGCTLEINGTGYFPDAPTDRGVKHLYELIRAVKEGYRAAAAFVIQMDGVTQVQANTDTHPAFGTALEEAVAAGVEVLCLPCHVEPDSLCVVEQNIWR